MILDSPLYRWSLWRHGKYTFREFLKLRDVDAQLGLSEAWPKDEEEETEGFDSEELDEVPSVLDQEQWMSYLEDEEGVDDTSQSNYERAVVLCLCPNVEEVLYGSNHNDKWRRYSDDTDPIAIAPIVYAAKGEPFGRVHRFEKLRYLSIDVQYMPIGDVIPILRLPSLRHLVLEWRNWATAGFNGDEADTALRNWGCPDRSSSVETLELRNVQCPTSIVRGLLRSCKALKSLSLDCGCLWEDKRKLYLEVLDQLRDHAGSLEELFITAHSM